ncbi:hypothetical protein HQ496_07605 [bacterium]|nr:hypothetical protein [bacterium]
MPGETVAIRDRTAMNTASWDSLCQLSLIISIEQEFDMTLRDEEAIELTSYAVALAIISGS